MSRFPRFVRRVRVVAVATVLLTATMIGAWQTVRVAEANRALITAVARGDVGSAQSALERGADPNARGPSHLSVTHSLVLRVRALGNDPKSTEYARRELGSRPNTALMIAARRCDPASVKLLLSRGASVNAQGEYGQTPLLHVSFAASKPADVCVDTARALLQAGANPNYASRDGHTPLLAALWSNNSPALLRVLLQNGANPDQIASGTTPRLEAKHRPIPSAQLVRDAPRLGTR